MACKVLTFFFNSKISQFFLNLNAVQEVQNAESVILISFQPIENAKKIACYHWDLKFPLVPGWDEKSLYNFIVTITWPTLSTGHNCVIMEQVKQLNVFEKFLNLARQLLELFSSKKTTKRFQFWLTDYFYEYWFLLVTIKKMGLHN